jgi:hypothetical protein
VGWKMVFFGGWIFGQKGWLLRVSCQDLPFMRSKLVITNLWKVSVGGWVDRDYLDGRSELP